jgi:hypothetical protein
MNLRPAAALALIGWYLMIPVVKNGKLLPLPVQDWAHVASFDTAKECEDGAYQRIDLLKERGSDPSMINAARTFECIASDDPRLAGGVSHRRPPGGSR